MMDRLGFGEFSGKVASAWETADTLLCISEHPAQTSVRPHVHDTPYFCLILSGSFLERSCLGERVHGAGTILFHPSQHPHEDEFMSREVRCLNIQVRNSWLDRNPGWLRRPRVGVGTRAARIATRVAQAVRMEDAASVEQWVDELALATVVSRQKTADPVALTVKRMLAERYSEPVRMPAIAAEIGIHSSQMSRVFLRSFGVTCGQFLGEVRLTHAARMLANSSTPIAEIALACGFFDQSHLANSFRKSVGMTPSRYRGCYVSSMKRSDFPRR